MQAQAGQDSSIEREGGHQAPALSKESSVTGSFWEEQAFLEMWPLINHHTPVEDDVFKGVWEHRPQLVGFILQTTSS